MMTKIYRVTPLAALMALLLAAGCTKERPTLEEPAESSSGTPSYGSTYMSLSLRTGGSSSMSEDSDTESAPNYKQDWVGDDDFTTFAVYVVSEKRNDVHYIGGPISGNADVAEFKDGKLTLTPWKTTPDKKTIYAFLNPPDQYVTWLGETLSSKGDFLDRIKQPIPFQGAPGITYSTQPEMYAFRPDPNIAKKVAVEPFTKVDPVPSFKVHPLELYKNEDTPLSFYLFNIKSATDELPPFRKYRDHMMCSGLSKGNNVEDNVTETEVKNRQANIFTMSVRRVLAQAVVTADNSILNKGIQGDPEKSLMRLRGLYYQVLNFEPTFYPIAQTTDNKWFDNKNTETPSSNKLAPTDYINFSTYETNVRNYPDFSPSTLIRDNYFRSMLFPKKEEIMKENKLMMPELLRRLELVKGEGFEGYTFPDFDYPEPYSTTLWGSCYVTETTHKWGKGTDSEYRKGNTPFFAVIAAFDIASLPWSSATSDGIASDIAKRQDLYDQTVAPWNAEIAQKKQQLESVLTTLKPLQDKVNRLEAEWVALVTPYLTTNPRKKRLDNVLKFREQYKNGEIDSKKFDDKVRDDVNTINEYICRKKETDKEKQKKRKEAEDKWAELRVADAEVDKNPHKKEAGKLNKEIKELETKVKEAKDRIFGRDGWFKDNYTRKLFELGANRIYYSLDEQKFYLDYHVIPVKYRGAGHRLREDAEWLTPLKEKRNEALRNGASATDLPEPTQPLLELLSGVLNGTTQAESLKPEQQTAMNYYLYGRVTPELAKSFGASSDEDAVDLHLGYVTWYTAKNTDKVVNYEVLIRKRARGSIKDGRLLMVYYAWLNPSTNNRATWYSSPVLRNNIYHMHITGFRRMGLSGIPFVNSKPNTYLHNLDPDEKVPSNDEYLPMTDTQMSVQVTNVGWGIHSYKNKL